MQLCADAYADDHTHAFENRTAHTNGHADAHWNPDRNDYGDEAENSNSDADADWSDTNPEPNADGHGDGDPHADKEAERHAAMHRRGDVADLYER